MAWISIDVPMVDYGKNVLCGTLKGSFAVWAVNPSRGVWHLKYPDEAILYIKRDFTEVFTSRKKLKEALEQVIREATLAEIEGEGVPVNE